MIKNIERFKMVFLNIFFEVLILLLYLEVMNECYLLYNYGNSYEIGLIKFFIFFYFVCFD